MDDWQEEIEVFNDVFFQGNAEIKYRADAHHPQSSESNENHYRLSSFYNIRISEIQKIEENTYNKFKCELSISDVEGAIIALHEGKEYEIEVFDLIATELPKVKHEQREGNELLGYFENVKVTFKMLKKNHVIVFKQGYPTGNIEERRDGYYEEYYNQDGSTSWRMFQKKCIEGEETGNIENFKNQYRKEYYHSDCSTYWGSWITKENTCVQDKWTGKKRFIDNYEEREYYNSDCTTYWKRNLLPGPGCLSSLIQKIGYLILILFSVFLLKIFILSGHWKIFFFIILFYILVGGLIWIIGFLGSKIGRLLPGIKVVNWLLSFLLFCLLLLGINAMFHSENWIKQQKEAVDHTNEHRTTYEPNPSPSPSQKVYIRLKWRGLNDVTYKGRYFLYASDINRSVSNLYALNSYGTIQSYREVYNTIYHFDSSSFDDLYRMLDSIKIANAESNFQFIQTIVSMVQSFKYSLILDENCGSQNNLRNTQIINLLRKGVECEGNYPFGLKTPVEFAADLKGDCDTRTLFLYTLLKHYNYDVAIINSEYYSHSMLGVSMPGLKGANKIYNGKRYYFWETTNKEFKVGFLPTEVAVLDFWRIILN